MTAHESIPEGIQTLATESHAADVKMAKGAVRCERRRERLGCVPVLSDTISDNQWHSQSISGTQ